MFIPFSYELTIWTFGMRCHVSDDWTILESKCVIWKEHVVHTSCCCLICLAHMYTYIYTYIYWMYSIHMGAALCRRAVTRAETPKSCFNLIWLWSPADAVGVIPMSCTRPPARIYGNLPYYMGACRILFMDMLAASAQAVRKLQNDSNIVFRTFCNFNQWNLWKLFNSWMFITIFFMFFCNVLFQSVF